MNVIMVFITENMPDVFIGCFSKCEDWIWNRLKGLSVISYGTDLTINMCLDLIRIMCSGRGSDKGKCGMELSPDQEPSLPWSPITVSQDFLGKRSKPVSYRLL